MGILRKNTSDDKRKFQMREKLMSIGDDYWIEDEAGNKAIRDKIKIELAGGREATVKKAMVGIRDRFIVEVDGGKDLKVHGNIVDHEYDIDRDGDKIAEVSKKWFRMRDTYGVEVEHDVDTVLVLAVTVAVDSFSHD